MCRERAIQIEMENVCREREVMCFEIERVCSDRERVFGEIERRANDECTKHLKATDVLS